MSRCRCISASSRLSSFLQTPSMYLEPSSPLALTPCRGRQFQAPAQTRGMIPGSEKHLLPQRGSPQCTGKTWSMAGVEPGPTSSVQGTLQVGLREALGSAGPSAPSHSWGRGSHPWEPPQSDGGGGRVSWVGVCEAQPRWVNTR